MIYLNRHFIQFLKGRLVKLNLNKFGYLPRWVVLCLDVILITGAFFISNLAFRSLDIEPEGGLKLYFRFSLILGVNVFFFYIFKTYSGLIRHSTLADLLKLGFASSATLIFLGVFHFIYLSVRKDPAFLFPVILFYTVLSYTFLLLFRLIVKQIYQSIKQQPKKGKRRTVAIYGVDDNAINLGQLLTSEANQKFNLRGFISLKPFSKYLRIAGKPVLGTIRNLQVVIEKQQLDGILIVGDALSTKEKNLIVNKSLEYNIQVLNAPLIEEWETATNSLQKIKSIEIDDLLDREAIHLDEAAISKDLKDKVILITGAAGSIGSELVRQIAKYSPASLILVDQAETPLHNLELELLEDYPELNFKPILAGIGNKHRMEALFRKYDISIVYHAAAYKHVPLIERNPREAILVNILGTINLAKLAVAYGTQKFVMVSTDKAVNPTNVMGASKRVAEMYVQSLQQSINGPTQFITTRFGNVLGSNGSVIPHFKEQIAKGGPLTVTHKDITRYFMTIPEACQLVLQAGTMGKGGEIFVFDMGQPVKILDLALRMIKLSGLRPNEDIAIKFIGLRPGEKLYEELLNDKSKTLPTHNKKIMIAKEECGRYEEINLQCKILIKSAIKARENSEMVMLLKELVPEFISQNSIYEILDRKVETIE